MANRIIPKDKIDSNVVRSYLKANRISIRQLATEVEYSDRTIRRALASRWMPFWLTDLVSEKTGLSKDDFVID